METKANLHFPSLTILSIKPLLMKMDKILSYQINAKLPGGEMVTMYENKGLDLAAYLDKKMTCILEITKAEFKYAEEDDKIPENTLKCKYGWLKRSYEYFPELVRLDKNADIADGSEKEQEMKQDLFEAATTAFFKEWGINGIQLHPMKDKPMLHSSYGSLLLNEYEFEEELDDLEFDTDVYIQIEEMFLRGITPVLIDKNEEVQPPKVYEIHNGKPYSKEEWKEYCKKNGSRLNFLE